MTTAPPRRDSRTESLTAPRSRRRARSGFELWTWVFMRASGALLVFLVLGHLTVNLVLGDGINAIDFALVAGRYANPFWQLWSLTILWLAMLHGANGLRVVINDYAERRATRVALKALVLLTTVATIALGTLVIYTFDPCPPGAAPGTLPTFCEE